MHGHWNVPDGECTPHWGPLRDDGCQREGYRLLSAILWNIPRGFSWEQAAERTPITINRFEYPGAAWYEKGLNMWGKFAVYDSQCLPVRNMQLEVTAADWDFIHAEIRLHRLAKRGRPFDVFDGVIDSAVAVLKIALDHIIDRHTTLRCSHCGGTEIPRDVYYGNSQMLMQFIASLAVRTLRQNIAPSSVDPANSNVHVYDVYDPIHGIIWRMVVDVSFATAGCMGLVKTFFPYRKNV